MTDVVRKFETLRIGEARIDAWALDVRVVRESSERGAYFVVYGADAQGPFTTVEDALAYCSATLPGLAWRVDLELHAGEVPCPTCGSPLQVWARYPCALCPVCVLEAVDDQGRRLRFSNTGLLGGFEARREDGGVTSEHECVVRGVRCRADEAYFGGIVVQRFDDVAR